MENSSQSVLKVIKFPNRKLYIPNQPVIEGLPKVTGAYTSVEALIKLIKNYNVQVVITVSNPKQITYDTLKPEPHGADITEKVFVNAYTKKLQATLSLSQALEGLKSF